MVEIGGLSLLALVKQNCCAVPCWVGGSEVRLNITRGSCTLLRLHVALHFLARALMGRDPDMTVPRNLVLSTISTFVFW